VGGQWSIIAQSLPGRTDIAVRARYLKLQKAFETCWHDFQDRLLVTLVAGQPQGTIDWNNVAQEMFAKIHMYVGLH
jgi:hypothetical protein